MAKKNGGGAHLKNPYLEVGSNESDFTTLDLLVIFFCP